MAEYRARVVLLLRAEDAERLGSWLLRDWLEEGEKPDLAQAKRFAEAVHKAHPGKKLAYNCSPSFNWKKNLFIQG